MPAMRPTRPPDDRRARHEARGEWPQPTLSALLDARLPCDAGRVWLIEGLRDGGRQFTFADLKRRADRMTVALARLGVQAGDVVSWQLPNWFEGAALAVGLDRVGRGSKPDPTISPGREGGFFFLQDRPRR